MAVADALQAARVRVDVGQAIGQVGPAEGAADPLREVAAAARVVRCPVPVIALWSRREPSTRQVPGSSLRTVS